jgi:hypothetical protein
VRSAYGRASLEPPSLRSTGGQPRNLKKSAKKMLNNCKKKPKALSPFGLINN